MIDRNNFFTPIYLELKEKLENEILAEGLSDGSFFCTLKDVCDRHDVSINTARKAVDALQKNGVVRSKSSRGIFVTDTGKLLDIKSLKNYVLIYHAHEEGSQNVYFSLRLGAMLEAFAENGITAKVIFKSSDSFPGFNIPADTVKGIVASSETQYEQLLRYSQMAPTLLLSGNMDVIPGVYSVVYDKARNVELATKYFSANKIREIVLVSHDEAGIAAFSTVLEKQLGGRFSVMKVDEPSIKCGRESVAALAALPPSTGILAGDDFIAVGIVDGFMKIGRDIREEKRIVAFANPKFPFTRQLDIPVVGNDPWVVGKTAAEFLCRIINGENPEECRSIVIEPEASWEMKN